MTPERRWIVPVLNDGPMVSTLVNPALKLRMQIFRPKQEPEEMIYALALYLDPDWDGSSVVERMPAEEVASSYFRTVPAEPLKLAISDQARRVLEIQFEASGSVSARGTGAFHLALARKEAIYALESLGKLDIPGISGAPLDFFGNLIFEFFMSEFWDNIVSKINKSPFVKVRYCEIRISIPEEAQEATGPWFHGYINEEVEGGIMSATREVRA